MLVQSRLDAARIEAMIHGGSFALAWCDITPPADTYRRMWGVPKGSGQKGDG